MKEGKDKRDHHLVLRGKIYWIRKRIPGTGKTYFKSLKTSDKVTARFRRTAHLRKLDAGVDEAYEKLKNEVAAARLLRDEYGGEGSS